MTLGGYGNLAHGRHQYGANSSEIEPRFYVSSPVDDETNVGIGRWIEFELYSYSSTVLPDDLSRVIEISEDSGVTYSSASVLPYTCTVRAVDGQRLWIKIRKSAPWVYNTTVVIRTPYIDEYGQESTKVTPVTWE